MTEQTVTHHTYVIERIFAAAPEAVFAAFANPALKRRWFAEGEGAETVAFEMDFRPGGTERTERMMGKNTPFPGVILTNDTVYQDIVPNRRLVAAYTMTLGERRISASLTTYELVPDGGGTKLIFTEQGAFFEGSDGPQMRQGGWQKLLERLANELALVHA